MPRLKKQVIKPPRAPAHSLATDAVHQGDCLELLARIPDGSVPLAFADPPFNIGYDYDTYDDRRSADDYLTWSRRWMAEIVRVLRPDGTFWLAIGDEYAAELKVLATRELGLTCRSWVVWYYTFGVNCRHKFSRSHAHIFHFVKDPQAFTFNDEAIRVPSARELVYGDRRANPAGRLPDGFERARRILRRVHSPGTNGQASWRLPAWCRCRRRDRSRVRQSGCWRG